jgi:hypothetical protein
VRPVPKLIPHKYRHNNQILLRGLSIIISASGRVTIQVPFKDQVVRFLSHPEGSPYLPLDDDQRKISVTLETRVEFLLQQFSSSIHCK